jgi:carboxyl-terminal processing protease
MPRRNLYLIFAAALVSLLFHTKARQNRYAGPFSEAIDLIKQNYIQPVDDRDLYEAAMDGMTKKLDENSGYLSPEEYTSMLQNSIELEFEGIGAHLTLNPPDATEERKEMTILMPILDGPADKAGVRAGDVILEINGKSTAGEALEDAVNRIKGPVGTEVTLTLRREGVAEPLKISIARAKVVFDSVIGLSRREDGRWNYFVDGEPSIKYLRLTTFATHTAEELGKRIGEFKRAGGIDALVLDLRDNLGGRLDAAVAVCDMLIKKGEIVTIRERGGHVRDRFTASGHNFVGDFPMAVLINDHSASASEITAACLQDHDRAVVIGTQSYGKGTVQDLIPLEQGRSRLKLTTATFWRPSKKNIQKPKQTENDPLAWGVRPDEGFEVPITERQEIEIIRSQIERSRPKLPQTANGKKPKAPIAPEPDATAIDIDPQLRKAVEYLRGKMAKRE